MRTLLWAAALGLVACSKAPEPAAPSPAPARAERNVVLFLGDSLTAGYGLALEDAFPALLDERWRRDGLGVRARNAGASGATTAGVLETLDWTLAGDVKTVFLCIGGNDGLRGLDLGSTRANIASTIEKARARGIRVVLAGMRIPSNYGDAYTRRFAAIFPELAREHGLAFMPFLLEGVGGRSGLNLPDGIHPNEAGHRLMAEHVHAFLAKEGLLR